MFNKTALFILQTIVVFVPASLILYYAIHAGGLPDNDYWGEMERIINEQDGEFSSNFQDWIKRSNEHYTLLPKLVYAANLLVTGGNNIGLSLFSWFMALLQVLLLYRLIPVKNKQHTILFTVLLFAVAVFIFSPRQAHNWILGMSGTAWITANFFSIAAIVALHRYVISNYRVNFYLIFFFSLCAVATYSTSLALFPTLVIAAFLYRLNRQEKLMITSFGIIILCFYYATFSTPSNHPAIQQSVTVLVTYILGFIGALFTLQIKYALIGGVFGVVSSVLISVYIYQKNTRWIIIIPWLSMLFYVCGNAAMAALARSGFGIDQVFASRYGSLSALFWLAWIMIALTACLQLNLIYRKLSLFILLSLSSVIIINTYRVGQLVAAPLLERAEKKSLSLASIYSHAIDIELINATGLPLVPYGEMESIINRLAAVQHIPFNGLFKQCPKIDSKISNIQSVDTEQVLGAIEQIRLLNHKVIEVNGWAYNGPAPVCIVLTNQNDIVRGIASYGIERLDVVEAIPAVLSNHSGWQGYGKVHKHDRIVKVYMLTEKAYWLLLNNSFQIHRHPFTFQKLVSPHDVIK